MKLPVAQQGVALGMFMAKNGTVATQTTKAPDPSPLSENRKRRR